MNKLIVLVLTLLISMGLYAQWSTNAATPNRISFLNDFQAYPNLSICPNGDAYIAWVEYDFSAENFNILLQRMNEPGIPQWTAPMVVTSHPSQSGEMIWDLTSDNEGNAIIAYYSERDGARNIFIYKVSPSGQMLWSESGINVSHDTAVNITNTAPSINCTTGNLIVVAWQRQSSTTTVRLQALNSAGTPLWGEGGIAIEATGGDAKNPKLLSSTLGNVLLKYDTFIGTGDEMLSYSYLKKLNPAGTDFWSFPSVQVSIPGFGVWSMDADGAGGAIVANGADRNNNQYGEIYLQHINSDGSLAFPSDGAPISTDDGLAQVYPQLAYDTQTHETYVVWCNTPVLPNYYSMKIQKLSSSGTKLWGDNGIEYLAMNNLPIYIYDAMILGGNFSIVYRIGLTAEPSDNYYLKAMSFSGTGQSLWQGDTGMVASTNTLKQNIVIDNNGSNAIIVWQDDIGPCFTYAMRLNSDGSLGFVPTGSEDCVLAPNQLWLQARPNPFRESLTMEYSSKDADTPASISMYNLKGEKVLHSSLSNPKGGRFQWDGKDQSGNKLAAGIYLIKMQQGNRQVVRKVVKLK